MLEIGPGTGRTLVALGQAAGSAGIACGLDLSAGMCRVARQRLTRVSSSALPAAIICGDAAELPVADGILDAVFMSFTLELFAPNDTARVLGECHRALRDGGRLGVVALSESDHPTLMQRLYGWAHRRFPSWVDCRPITVKEILEEQHFRVHNVTHSSMWGLTLAVAIASRNAFML